MLTLFIPFGDAPWSKLFGALESGKTLLHIETYSVSQTTLEQIFIAFTKEDVKKTDEVSDEIIDIEQDEDQDEDNDVYF